MKRTVAVIALALATGTIACGAGPNIATFDEGPILDHLSNVISTSGLPGETIQELDATLQAVTAEPGATLEDALNTIRAETMTALSAFEGQDSLDAGAELRMRALVEVMNLTHAIGQARGMELALAQVVRKNHKCDRIGSHGQCVADARYNCSHIGGSCFHVRK